MTRKERALLKRRDIRIRDPFILYEGGKYYMYATTGEKTLSYYFGLRDDINQISGFVDEHCPNDEIDMSFSFDEHAFLVKNGERIRIDISSSAWPHYVPHTNQKGLFSEQKTARIAKNTVDLSESYIEFPILK